MGNEHFVTALFLDSSLKTDWTNDTQIKSDTSAAQLKQKKQKSNILAVFFILSDFNLNKTAQFEVNYNSHDG